MAALIYPQVWWRALLPARFAANGEPARFVGSPKSQRDQQDQKQVAFAADALLIDTGYIHPAEVCTTIIRSLLTRVA